jgi:hypothetical protein
MFKNVEDFQKFNKEQLEAVAASTETLTKGVQQIAAEATDYSKKAFETSSAYVEKLMGVKSFDKAIEVHTEFAKSHYEGLVAQASKFGELYSTLAKEAFKPVEGAIAKVQAAAK